MADKYFLTQVKRTNNIYEKGCVVKDTSDEILQAFHAYLGAYAYGHDANTDYVYVEAVTAYGDRLDMKFWESAEQETQE